MKHATLLCAALALATACGDDDGSDDTTDLPPADMGAMVDSSMPMADAGPGDDLGVDPTCDAESCVNGACETDVCVCDDGWTGASCEDLDEPATDGVLLWFDADMPETLTISDGNQVDAWEARFAVGGGGATVTAPSDGQRPRFQPGTSTWGHGALGFDGVDDKLVQEGLWPGLAGRTDYTVFGVYTHARSNTSAFTMTDPEGNPGFGLGTGPLSRQMMCLYGDGDGDTALVDTEADATPSSGIQVVVLRVTTDGANMRLNGAEVDRQASAITLALPASEIVFGAESVDGDMRTYAGAIGEVIVYGTALDEGALTAVEDYLLAKWQSM